MRRLFQIARENKTDALALIFMLIGLGLPLAIFSTVENWGVMP